MEVKNYWRKYDNYKTVKQWEKLGFVPAPEAVGVQLWTNFWHEHSCRYYAPDEVIRKPDRSKATV